MPAPKKLPSRHGARNIVRWVNSEHRGNVRAAADDLGVSYDQLYNVVTGRSRPGVALVCALVQRDAANRPYHHWLDNRSIK